MGLERSRHVRIRRPYRCLQKLLTKYRLTKSSQRTFREFARKQIRWQDLGQWHLRVSRRSLGS